MLRWGVQTTRPGEDAGEPSLPLLLASVFRISMFLSGLRRPIRITAFEGFLAPCLPNPNFPIEGKISSNPQIVILSRFLPF